MGKKFDFSNPVEAGAIAKKIMDGGRVSPSTLNGLIMHWMTAVQVSEITGVPVADTSRVARICSKREMRPVIEKIHQRALLMGISSPVVGGA